MAGAVAASGWSSAGLSAGCTAASDRLELLTSAVTALAPDSVDSIDSGDERGARLRERLAPFELAAALLDPFDPFDPFDPLDAFEPF